MKNPTILLRDIGRLGLSLIEIMIALTMTLIVLGAMMTAFQYASEKMQAGRAVMELANRSRAAEALLRSDLAGLTVQPRPYTQTTTPPGCFEYIEGNQRDFTATSLSAVDSYLGDVDDILDMTVRANGRPFRGRWDDPAGGGPIVIESPLAEVVWFTTWTNSDADALKVGFNETVRVHRRVLLIAPAGITSGTTFPLLLDEATIDVVNDFFKLNDISARVVPGDTNTTFDVIANSLDDLSIRKNRFCHFQDPRNPTNDPNVHNFPNILLRDYLLKRLSTSDRTLLSTNGGSSANAELNADDIVLSDVSAFDLQIYAPDAAVDMVAIPDLLVEPSDIGFVGTGAPALGSFVDLFYAGSGWFKDPSNAKSKLNYEEFIKGASFGWSNVYDTWTPLYESDGINQDGDALTDEGTDGLDNPANASGAHVSTGGTTSNGVDDIAERETLPPYPNPIRGMKITIRLVEKGTKQVHQTTVIHSFVPE